jgi:hypothetical protein
MTTPEDKTPTERIRERTEELKKGGGALKENKICPFMSYQAEGYGIEDCHKEGCAVWSSYDKRCGLIN